MGRPGHVKSWNIHRQTCRKSLEARLRATDPFWPARVSHCYVAGFVTFAEACVPVRVSSLVLRALILHHSVIRELVPPLEPRAKYEKSATHSPLANLRAFLAMLSVCPFPGRVCAIPALALPSDTALWPKRCATPARSIAATTASSFGKILLRSRAGCACDCASTERGRSCRVFAVALVPAGGRDSPRDVSSPLDPRFTHGPCEGNAPALTVTKALP